MVAVTSFLDDTSSDRLSAIRSWLTTTDHKRIGLLYLFVVLFWFTIAMMLGGLEPQRPRFPSISR